jgi:hypothetical protein
VEDQRRQAELQAEAARQVELERVQREAAEARAAAARAVQEEKQRQEAADRFRYLPEYALVVDWCRGMAKLEELERFEQATQRRNLAVVEARSYSSGPVDVAELNRLIKEVTDAMDAKTAQAQKVLESLQKVEDLERRNPHSVRRILDNIVAQRTETDAVRAHARRFLK